MRYASVTNRLQGLGSDKWRNHLRAKQMLHEGLPIIMLSIGEPDIAPPTDLMDVAAKAMRAGRTAYSSGRGEPSVLKALAAKYSKRTGRKISENNVVCLPGTQTALYAVMTALVEAGDEVLVGDPLYATYDGIIRSTGATRVSVPLDANNGFRMKASDVEKAITPRTKVLLMNSPHNPTGAVLSAQDIAEIGAVCTKHNLWIISDEVYEDLIFGGTFASPYDDADLAARTVVVSSISKSHAAPGFRSGWCVGPVEFTERLLPLAETMLFGNQPFIADMTAYAVAQPPHAAMHMRKAFERRAEIIVEAFQGSNSFICRAPEAGMFLLADVSKTGLSGEEFAARLLDDAHVAVMPGSSFGDQINGFIRISLTVPDETISVACDRIKAFLASL